MEVLQAIKTIIALAERDHKTPIIVDSKPVVAQVVEEAPVKMKKKRKEFVWTEKRRAAFELCKQKRQENLLKRKQEKEAKSKEESEEFKSELSVE